MNYAYLGLQGFWGFYSSIGLTSVSWPRRSFLVGEIFFNLHILQNPLLIGVFLIRVYCGAQDISLYTYVWRPSKAISDSSKVYLSSSACLVHSVSYLSPSTYPSRHLWLPVDQKSVVISFRMGPSILFCHCSRYSRVGETDDFVRVVAFI